MTEKQAKFFKHTVISRRAGKSRAAAVMTSMQMWQWGDDLTWDYIEHKITKITYEEEYGFLIKLGNSRNYRLSEFHDEVKEKIINKYKAEQSDLWKVLTKE